MQHKKLQLAGILAVVLSIGIADPVLAASSRTNASTTWIKNSADYPVKIKYCTPYIPEFGSSCYWTPLIQPDGIEIVNIVKRIAGTEVINADGETVCITNTKCFSDADRVIVFRGFKPNKSCYFSCA